MKTGYVMSIASRRDYLQKIYPRYREASREEKRGIVDEFCANCGYNRKYAIRLLNGAPPGGRPTGKRRRQRGMTYGPQWISILKGVWETADYPWSALLPEWMPWIGRQYRLSAGAERQLLQISARSIDRRRGGVKRKLRRRLYGRTKPGTLLKHHIPLKTDHWDVKRPGFTEIDLVSHSGNSASGDFCYSLNVTDIHRGWTETRAVLGRVRRASEPLWKRSDRPCRSLCAGSIPTTGRSSSIPICGVIARRGRSNSRAGGPKRKTTTRILSRRTGRTCGGCSVTSVTTRRRRGKPWCNASRFSPPSAVVFLKLSALWTAAFVELRRGAI